MPFDVTSAGSGSGFSPASVGTTVDHLTQSTDLTLTASDMFKRHVVRATQEISVTLPDATTIPGGAQSDMFGLESIGAPVNLRNTSGKLLARFTGKTNRVSRMRNAPPLCRLNLLDASSADGLWQPGLISGNLYAPRLVNDTVAGIGSMDTQSVPTAPDSFLRLSDDRLLLLWRENTAGGQKCRVVKVNGSTGAVTLGTPFTLSTYDGAGYLNALHMDTIGGNEILVIAGVINGASSYGSRVLEINDMTIQSAGAYAAYPLTDNNGDTLTGYQYSYAALVKISTTKFLISCYGRNVTDANHFRPHSFFGTLSGTPPTTLSWSTPQDFVGHTSWASRPSSSGLLCPNVANRVFIDNAYAFPNGLALDVSGADPTVAYEIQNADMPYDWGTNVGRVSFDTVDGWIYVPDNTNGLWRFKCGSSAISDMEFLGKRQSPFDSVGGDWTNTHPYRTPHVNYLWVDGEARYDRFAYNSGGTFRLIDLDNDWPVANVTADRSADLHYDRAPNYTELEVPYIGFDTPTVMTHCNAGDSWFLQGAKETADFGNQDGSYHFSVFEWPEF